MIQVEVWNQSPIDSTRKGIEMKLPLKFPAGYLILALLPALSVPASDTVEEPETLFSQAALDQMLAPIALYPDALLSQVLIASTYPLEVVEASRWSRANPELEGDAAVTAVEDMDWDPSIKALTGFPDLLQLLDENLTWTRRLGGAFLLQEEEVMETVQNLRQAALEEGSLDKLEHVVVSREEEIIYIEPASTRVIYVPYYDTRYVYGSWWWYDYPPVCWWTPGPIYHSSIGFHWSSGFHFHTSFFYSSCYWPSRRVVVVDHYKRHPRPHYKDGHRDRHDYRDAPAWRHDPIHRRGVRYPSEDLEARHARHSASSISRRPLPEGDSRMEHRISRHPDQKPIPVETPVQLARGNRESERSGPVPSGNGTRQPQITRDTSSSTTSPVISRSDRANRLARAEEARRTMRTTQVTSTTRPVTPKPVVRSSSSRIDTSKKPEASPRSNIARTEPRPKPTSQAQPSRQSTSSTSRSSSGNTNNSGNNSNYNSNSNKSYSGSSNSSWKSNNSYASSNSSRQDRAAAGRQAPRPHER